MPRNSSRAIKRILVTGGSGFLGKILREELRVAHPQARIFYTFLKHGSPSSNSIRCDLLNPGQIDRCLLRSKPDVIFHLVGDPTKSKWEDSWDIHVRATFNLMEAVRRLPEQKRPKTVVSGSASEYGYPLKLPVRETDLPQPATFYGNAKYCQTIAALAYSRMGMDVVVGRLFNLFGPGLPGYLAIGSFARQISEIEKGRVPARLKVGDLSKRRDYVDVRDASRALILLAQKGRFGEVYNIGSGKSVSIGRMLGILLGLSPRKIKVIQEPSRKKAVDPANVYGSFKKLKTHTGWRPRISLSESLKDTLDSFRVNG